MISQSVSTHIDGFVQDCGNSSAKALGPVLLLRHDAVARILVNGSAAYIESCAAIDWNFLRQCQIAIVRQGPGVTAVLH